MVSTRPPATGGNTSESIEVVPLTLHIGAEIRGVDLTEPLPPDQLKAVRDAFLKWKVIFFRDQIDTSAERTLDSQLRTSHAICTTDHPDRASS